MTSEFIKEYRQRKRRDRERKKNEEENERHLWQGHVYINGSWVSMGHGCGNE